ncbi:MAG: radical SAM family heme chaperone HemW [SAR202 cluster bacterium]|jgi:oxygen-independent coproporphyrinogen-3 oxidase|nr:coproporphyrinogen III oxidase [Chloroflexota bacterium]MDP6425743.1 radical SAM family heme chaperone HemW [Dehalococcoidia bacterium]MQG46946.1 radical SAM family heme chaperone HemW [SAR202 cluster bacterium]
MPDFSTVQIKTPEISDGLGLYVHIPFCFSKCNYCDFNTYAGIENQFTSITNALVSELNYWGEVLQRPKINTVFLGGGTPSYLPDKQKTLIFETINSKFNLDNDVEITMECNPDDITPSRLDQWVSLGLNRLSLGVQSFDETILQSIDRRHTGEDALKAIECSKNSGVDNINIDLMFGLPNQELSDWAKTIKLALETNVSHLSIYGLQLEKGTPLEASVLTGKISTPGDESMADMYETVCKLLKNTNYKQYEISNWSLEGKQCKHNLLYWENKSYIGCGPGASSYVNGVRFTNIKSPKGYVKAIKKTKPNGSDIFHSEAIFELEPQTVPIAVLETMMLGLRLNEGISDNQFRKRLGTSMFTVFEKEIRELVESGLITKNDRCLKLTRRGQLLANEVISKFVV